MIIRVTQLQVVDRMFLKGEGEKRSIRYQEIHAHRGIIFDRTGRPLAVSTKLVSIWAAPEELEVSDTELARLARLLNIEVGRLKNKLKENKNKDFVYLQRQVPPTDAKEILDLKLRGIYGHDEYKRYYPAGSLASHVVGLTNIDDNGQEGVELSFNKWLSGNPGRKRVSKDRRGWLVREAEIIKSAEPGNELMLSIDLRIQYVAYRELKRAVQDTQAESGALVILDVGTGEVLAMVNQPTFNPNNRIKLQPDTFRNRVVLDQFEPGSVIKPIVITAALMSGLYNPETKINTHPGYYSLGNNTIRDVVNYGEIDISTIIAKSSNVGISKIGASLEDGSLLELFKSLGFGQLTGVAYPGESSGYLPHKRQWSPIDIATLTFGYGLTVSPLQLAQAYMTLANDGLFRPVTLLKVDIPPNGDQVIPESVAKDVISMMKKVVAKGGTGTRAHVDGYQVAGKTGTVRKLQKEGYLNDKHIGSFVGVIPADNPKIVMVVIIDTPTLGKYYGGLVAAPVFQKVASETMRILNIPRESITAGEIETWETGISATVH